jgi:hypothetical protein
VTRLLVSWSGLGREPWLRAGGMDQPGAHLQLLRDSPSVGRFDAHALLAVSATLDDANRIALALAAVERAPRTRIELVDLVDPADITAIARVLANTLPGLAAALAPPVELHVLLSTGTPQMQSAWLLLGAWGLLRARFWLTVPPRLALQAGLLPTREVTLDEASWRREFGGLLGIFA